MMTETKELLMPNWTDFEIGIERHTRSSTTNGRTAQASKLTVTHHTNSSHPGKWFRYWG